MRSALLRGREHVELGAIDVIAEGCAAIAITLGGARKRYAHVDPNEDAALLAHGPAGTLVAVADGHHGFEAAEVALEYLVEYPGPHWTEPGTVSADTWTRQAGAVLEDANRGIRAERAGQGEGPRTTLAFALWLRTEGLILHASVGDSHLYRVGSDGNVRDLAARPGGKPFFLGQTDADAAAIGKRAIVGAVPSAGVAALVLATDGLSEHGIGVDEPEAEVRAAVEAARALGAEHRPLATAREVLERACAAHRRGSSGDNAACAVIWIEGTALGAQ